MFFPTLRRIQVAGRIAVIACGLVLGAVSTGAAQERGSVLVTVTDRTSTEPLINVLLKVQGTTLSGLTDAKGRVLLPNVPPGRHIITAERIGYGMRTDTVDVVAGQIAQTALTLNVRIIEMEGLVVTGTAMGAQRREVGNSIATITSADIEKYASQNFEDILRGHALGVSVTGSPGSPGAGSDIVLRGVNSVNGRNQPLIYVDGIRMPSGLPESTGASSENASFLGGINPMDIERIEIIKGPAASTLYGTEASAGVIQIFMKRGQAGAPRWTFSTGQSYSTIGHVGPSIDPTGLHVNDCTRQLVFDSVALSFSTINERDPGCPSSGSWLRGAHVQDYQLAASGGAGDVTYRVSSGWNNAQGVVAPQNAGQLSLSGNFTFTGLKNLTFNLSNSYSRRNIRWVPNGDNTEGLLYNVARGVEGETPDNNDALVLAKELDQFINQFRSGLNINWTPSATFRHRLSMGIDFSNSHYITEEPWQYFNNPEGERSADVENQRVMTFDYAGSWFKALTADFSSTLSWGGQYNLNEHLGLRGDAFTFLGPGDKVLQNGEEFTAQEDRDLAESGGFLLQEQIGWKNRLFIIGGLRADTHSAFGENYQLDQKFTLFPKLQATYTLSDHGFWPDWWETFRVRSAYGESGDPPGADDPVTLFQVAGADDNRSGFIIINQGNPDIGPERASEVEWGADGSIFNGRASFTLTGYKRKTRDGRIFINPPPSNGIAEQVPMNVGSWMSQGTEASVDLVLYERAGMRFNINAGYSYNRTEMEDLGSPEFNSFNFNYLNTYRVGYPLPSLFGNKVINADSIGQLPVYTTDGNQFFGPTRPPRELSLGVGATLFSRLTLDAFGVGQYGHVIYDDLAQEMAEVGLWPACFKTNALVERFQRGDSSALAGIPTKEIAKCGADYARNEDWAEKGNYFRLQSASATYRLPESWLRFGLTGAQLQLRATNLFTITNFSGLYPDALIQPLSQVARGAGYILPPPRTYSLNFRFNF